MTTKDNEAAIRHLIEDWVDAICQGGMDRVLANRTQDVVMFDVPEPIQAKGLEAYRQTWELFFAETAKGPLRFKLNEPRIVAGEDTAYAHALLDIDGGAAICRLTLGLRKVDDAWLVTHEHHSMPHKLG